MDDNQWMTLPQVMSYTQFGRTKIMDALKSGELAGFRHGGTGSARWRFKRCDVDAWIEGKDAVVAS